MITILTEKDLALEAQEKDIKDIEITDIAKSLDPVIKSSLVLLLVDSWVKILKDRTSSKQGNQYWSSATANLIRTHIEALK